MSDFFYLRDKNICPHCRVWRSPNTGKCHNCGTKLFISTCFSFHKFEEETGIMYWWAYSGETQGWKARDHFMVESAAPLIRHYITPKLGKDYGQKLPERGGKKIRVRRK